MELHRLSVLQPKSFATGSIAVGAIVAVLGCLYGDNQVYSRYRGEECSAGVFCHSVKDSAVCCEGHRGDDWVCIAAYDDTTAAMSGVLAWILPLLPLLFAALSDLLFESDKLRPGVLRRGLAYMMLFAYRTFLLHAGLGYLQELLQDTEGDNNCWYKTIGKRCKVEFDFSDHVVLFLVQYCVPVSFELSYCLSRRVSSLFHRMVQLANTLTCLLLLGFSFRGIFFTSTYFHTSAEILAGFTIVISFVYFPIINDKLLEKIFR